MELTLIGIALGIFVGVVLGLTGAGGAILSGPLLGFFPHLEVAQAAPIGLLAMALSSGLAICGGIHIGTIDWSTAGQEHFWA